MVVDICLSRKAAGEISTTNTDTEVNNIQLSPEGEVYIHGSSPTLRGIVVLVFTKSDG